ncbi:MFS transporter [Virgibacillus sp. Bac330]|uniref:MFS transporter n=1 Tax=Virgibacillus sp. Bac330 TaxID=2419841 RepID=UPI001F09DD1C|nr:MFS transporter [Virgibacillus sp. Bac330]
MLLQNKYLMYIWFAQTASGLGNTFSVFILSWLLYDLTESTISMSTLWFVYMTFTTLSILISGPYLDKVDKKKIMIFSEWVRSIAFLTIFFLVLFGNLSSESIYFVTSIVGIVEPLFRPASNIYIKQVVPEKNLLQANSLLESTLQTMMLIGPTLGGLLIGLTNPIFLISLLIFTLFISGFILLFLPNYIKDTSTNTQNSSTWLNDFKKGVNYYKNNKLFLWISLLVVIVNFSAGSIQPLLLPYVLDYLDGSSFHYGLFSSSVACGMLLGSILLTTKREFKNLKQIMLGSILLAGLSICLLSTTTHYLIGLFGMIMFGFFTSIFNINNTTLFQKRVPKLLLGRVLSIRSLFARLGIPFGTILGGILAETIGFNYLFYILGLLIIIPCVIAWFLPSLQQLNTGNNHNSKKVNIKSIK